MAYVCMQSYKFANGVVTLHSHTHLVVVITELVDRMPMQLVGLCAGNENILERLHEQDQ